MAASGRYRLRFCNASRCWIILIYRLECLRTFCSLLFSIQMTPYAPFLNHAGRLRSGWRLGVYLLAFLAVNLSGLMRAVPVIVFLTLALPYLGLGPDKS